MAESRDLAQTPANCQFCDETEIRWRCLNCELFLCQSCTRRIHSKSKICQDHTIIGLKDFGTVETAETIRNVGLQNIACKHHSNQRCVSYCGKCDETICLKCLNKSHQTHEQLDLSDVYNDILSRIKKTKDETLDDLSYLTSKEKNLQKIQTDNKNEYSEIKERILSREKDIKDALSNMTQALLEQFEDMFKPSDAIIQDKLTKIKLQKDYLMSKQHETGQILISHLAVEIFEASRFSTERPNREGNEIPKTCFKFIQGYSKYNLKGVLGNIYKTPEISLRETYQTYLKTVGNILLTCEREQIISSFRSGKLQRVNCGNNSTTIIQENDTKVFDMAMMETGEVIIASGEEELKVYNKNGSLESYRTFPSLKTTAINVTDDMVLVGLADSWRYDSSTECIRKVVVLNRSGDIQHVYECDQNNQRLFTFPRRIETCEGNICVIDSLNSSNEGRVVVFDYRGHIIWTYFGNENIEGSNKFYPFDITVSSTCMILISDSNNHAMHVLNYAGQVIVCHQLRDIGIEFPYCLQFDRDGLLWIGCTRSKGDVSSSAKIHVLDFK